MSDCSRGDDEAGETINRHHTRKLGVETVGFLSASLEHCTELARLLYHKFLDDESIHSELSLSVKFEIIVKICGQSCEAYDTREIVFRKDEGEGMVL